MAPNETVLITGAGGFIGGWLSETLYLNGSAKVRAGIRSWSSAARLARFPVDIVLCDVMNLEQITHAMAGVNRVVHCAYGSRQVTVQGTRNVLDVARKMGVERLVHISTTEVYGHPSGEIDETFPRQYTGNPYGDSKIEAEDVCWEYFRQGLPVTVIRPSIVYGPFGRTWTIELANKLQSGRWGLLEGYGDGVCNLLYIADLVSGILLAARHPAAVGEAFNLRGPEPISWNEYFQRFNTALGLPQLSPIHPGRSRVRSTLMEPARSSAKFVLDRFGGPIKRISQNSRHAREAMKYVEKVIKTTPRAVDLSLYNRHAVYLMTKARDVLGFEPKFDVEHGLDLTVRWLAQAGLVDQTT